MTLALILPVRRIVPMDSLETAAAEIRAMAGPHLVACSGVQTTRLPHLGPVAVVAVRMHDPRGPTDLCSVILGDHSREALQGAIAFAVAPARAA